MMRLIFGATLLALSACTTFQSDTTFGNVDAITNQMSAVRDIGGGDFIYVRGSLVGGASDGQTTTFIVTPNDGLLCTFNVEPVQNGDGNVDTFEAYEQTVPNLYADLSAILLPNARAVGGDLFHFTVESRMGGQLARTAMDTTDARYDDFVSYITTNLNPCWNFG